MTSVATHPPLGALVWTRSRTRVPPVVTMALRESPKRVFESMAGDGTDPVLIEHLHWMHVGDCAPRTIYERRRLITRLGRAMDKPILQATTEDINAFLLTAASPGTRNAYYNTCHQFYLWAFRSELITRDPTVLIRRPRTPRRVPRPLAMSDIAKAMMTADIRVETMMMLGVYEGLRCCEIAQVRGEDVDLTRMELFIPEGKGGHQGCVPLHADVAKRADLFPRTGYWFPAMNLPGGHMAASSVSAAISRAFQRAGVAGTGHRLRHTFGTAVYAQGKDIRATQDLLRHKWITTTQVYADSPMSDRRAIVDTLTV